MFGLGLGLGYGLGFSSDIRLHHDPQLRASHLATTRHERLLRIYHVDQDMVMKQMAQKIANWNQARTVRCIHPSDYRCAIGIGGVQSGLDRTILKFCKRER